MKIIITESQKESLDYYQLSNCIKRRLDIDALDKIVIKAMEVLVGVRSSIESFVESVCNFTYDKLDLEYGIEICWGDETWEQFSIPIKRFLDSRYDDTIKKYFENYYN
jgi:hypothetical protein